MKRSIKFLLAAALTLGATGLFAQKFGRIDMNDVIQSMPEMKDVQTNFEKAAQEYQDHLEGLQVELNNKLNDYQKVAETLSQSMQQLRMREMQELQERLQQYQQIAQEGLQQTEVELMTPLQQKAEEAVKKICKAEGIMVVFQQGSVVYIDEATTVDITAKVKSELGISATAAAAPAVAAPAK